MRTIILLAWATACVLPTRSIAVPVCENGQLKVTVEDGGAGMSHWAQVLQFLNQSTTACQLAGVPEVDLLMADRRRFSIPVCPNCGAYMFPVYPVHPVILKPGEQAHALISSVTAYDKPLCGTTEYIRIALARGKPAILLKNSDYSCVSLNVSPYLSGSAESSDRWANGLPSIAPTVWGQPVGGVQLSLTSFASEQKVGYLGFHVVLRGMNQPDAPPVVNCEKATLRIWRGDRLVREVSSSLLACVAVTPPVKPYPSMTGHDISTAFFDVSINEPGAYSFELVEQFKGDKLLMLTSNRVAVQIVSDKP